jgi:L-rhamnose-H+ transport protein
LFNRGTRLPGHSRYHHKQRIDMSTLGLILAFLSGTCNGLFTTPMKLIPRWKWENIWLVFILVSCVVMPVVVVSLTVKDYGALLSASPRYAVVCALSFGFAFGFGAIMFGLSVERLGISLANSLVIGLSAALGSIVPLALQGALRLETRQLVLFLGVVTFLLGVWLCGTAGKLREGSSDKHSRLSRRILIGYLLSIGSGIMNAILNIGFALAQPIAEAGVRLGYSRFHANNGIWLLMLGAASLPNVVFCVHLVRQHHTANLFVQTGWQKGWSLSVLMGLLWGGSIFLYGAATPMLGDIGPSIGWPLSLSVALMVANLMGFLLGEWRTAGEHARKYMRYGILTLIVATLICAGSSRL